jgi:hypothetical protein
MMHRLFSIFALGFLWLAAGCGESTVGVRGRVTLDQKPVEQGAISFEPADGNGSTSGAEIIDGEYELIDNARITPGPKIVRIRATRKTGRVIPKMPGSAEMIEEYREFIPDTYNNRSTLKVDVVPGSIQELNFDLKSKP